MAQITDRQKTEIEWDQNAVPAFTAIAGGRRVRVIFGGQTVADSRRALLVLERQRLPVYYFPVEDVRREWLAPSGHQEAHSGHGAASYWTVTVGKKNAQRAAWSYDKPEHAELAGHLAFVFQKMDAWFEEDDEIFAHPRSPYHRVDVLNSSRRVKVVIDGEPVAESDRPRILIETGLPPRYYLPKVDVRLDLLTPTATHTRCPYKGEASYWSVTVNGKEHKDIVWGYPAPLSECSRIENLVCFYNEKVDLYLDGELQERPKSPWS
ncbi:MAG: DUF427 domain-containing protein [Chloroflexi bacterium]|nr:MAG: DUF427 domain-containing protein [Chloroflexota bacterium]